MKFYQKTWFIILMLIFVWPVGLFLMWKYTTWNKILKGIITVFLVWLAYGMITAKPQPQEAAKPAPAKTEQAKLPEKKEPEKKALVFDKAIEKVTEELKDKQNFPYTKDVHFEVNNEKKEVVMTAIMNNGLKKWVAMEFADTMIRRFSFWAAFYNDTLKGPDKDSYGSLFDEYGIFIVVGSSADGKNNYYEKFIRPKMHTKQGPDWKEAQRKGE